MLGFCLKLNFNAMLFKLIFKEKLKSLDLIYVYFLKDKNFHCVFFFVVFKILLYFPLMFSLQKYSGEKKTIK